jgi:site-specific DNA-methyltransferase (adenine-specific)
VTEPAQRPHFTLHHGDCLKWLPTIPTASVDLVITDPAYESLEKHRAVGTTTRLTNDWFPIFPNTSFVPLFLELHRVLKPNSHFYMFCDQETMFVAKPLAELAGFRFWKPLVWDKVSIGMGYHYRARYEFVLFFEKGKRKLTDLGAPDIITSKRVRGGYPTEKPVDVSTLLMRQSSQPGDTVLDPFMGSGSVGEAALASDRNFVGGDIQQRSLELTHSRLYTLGDWRMPGVTIEPPPKQVELFGGAA